MCSRDELIKSYKMKAFGALLKVAGKPERTTLENMVG